MKANLKMIEIYDLAYKELTREIAKEKKDKLQLMILNEMAQY